MRDVYVGLSRRHAGQDELCALFRGLAEEEEQLQPRASGCWPSTRARGTWARDAATRISGKLDAISTELLGLVAELGDELAETLFTRAPPARDRRRAPVQCHSRGRAGAKTAEIDVQLLFSALARQPPHHGSLLELGARPGDTRPPPLPRTTGPAPLLRGLRSRRRPPPRREGEARRGPRRNPRRSHPVETAEEPIPDHRRPRLFPLTQKSERSTALAIAW